MMDARLPMPRKIKSPTPERVAVAAALAAQLARERPARLCTAERIGDDALAIVREAETVRASAERGRVAQAIISHIQDVLQFYNAELIYRGDVNGMVLGARFASGTYRCGTRDVFHIV